MDRSGIVSAWPTPLKAASATGRRDFNRTAMAIALAGFPAPFVAIEKVDAAPMRGRVQGTTSMFSFGRGFGLWLGILEAYGIPYVEVPPRTWKKAVLKGYGTDKAAAVRFVEIHHPGVRLVLPRCRKPHDGIADAVCLANYAEAEHLQRQLLAVYSAPGPRPARPREVNPQAEECE
jgi:crossover junction endodeoxyribonuclease RuvC